jgi:nucleotide-binding universal stress UspA family protein
MSIRILVPIEGSPRDDEALAVARQIARQESAEVVLAHVAPMMFDTADLVAAEQRLDAYATALRADGIEAHFLMEYGEASTKLAEAARRQNAQMIVLAPSHRALLETLWHPRVSSGLLHQATTPLLIVPDAPPTQVEATELLRDSGAKVILAVDGSQNAEAALPMAIQLAQSYQRPLLLVRVVAPVFILGAGIEALQAQREAQYAEEAEAHHYLVALRKRLEAETHLSVETMQLVGAVVEQLTHFAASQAGSVLVLGTHGHSGLKRVVVGSVAAGVLSRTTAPVIIVPSRPSNHPDSPLSK